MLIQLLFQHAVHPINELRLKRVTGKRAFTGAEKMLKNTSTITIWHYKYFARPTHENKEQNANKPVSPRTLCKHIFVGNHDISLFPTRFYCLLSMRRLKYENNGDSHILLHAAKLSRAALVTQSLRTKEISQLPDPAFLTDCFVR